jgi:F-type H+-transporting ATPase subunit alpha
LDQAQYESMAAFAKFGSDLDAATKLVLDKGVRNVEVLKQPQYSPLSVEKQVAMVYLSTNNLLRNVPVEKVREFESQVLSTLDAKYKEVLEDFRKGGLSEDSLTKLKTVAADISAQYNK